MKCTNVIPYMVGLKEAIRKTHNKLKIRVAFKSDTVKSTFMEVKATKQVANMVYEVLSIVS